MSTNKVSSQKAVKASSTKKDSKSSKGKQTQDKPEEGRQETVWVEPAQFPEEEEDEPEYEVEEIVAKKIKRGVIYYQVKWKGFPIEDATWEPEDNLDHAPLKIRAFENQQLNVATEVPAKDKKGKGEPSSSNTKSNGKESAVSNKLSALASNDDTDSLLGKRSRTDVESANAKAAEQEDKKKNKNSLDSKKAPGNGVQKEDKSTKKVDRRTLEEKEALEEDSNKDEKAAANVDKPKRTEGKTSLSEEKVTDSKEKKNSMEEEKSEPIKTKKNDQAASTSGAVSTPAAAQANQAAEGTSGNRANKDEGMSLSRIMQDEKLMEGSETEEPSVAEPRETDGDPNKAADKSKKGKKEQGEYGSLDKDIPMKVIGIRPVKEENDLEVMVSWKPRENGVKPYNSKIMRLALLKKGHWMPLIEFYESKMKLESAPNFDPTQLPRCNP